MNKSDKSHELLVCAYSREDYLLVTHAVIRVDQNLKSLIEVVRPYIDKMIEERPWLGEKFHTMSFSIDTKVTMLNIDEDDVTGMDDDDYAFLFEDPDGGLDYHTMRVDVTPEELEKHEIPERLNHGATVFMNKHSFVIYVNLKHTGDEIMTYPVPYETLEDIDLNEVPA